MSEPGSADLLEGGTDTTWAQSLRRPWVLVALVVGGCLAAAGLAVTRPWEPGTAPTANTPDTIAFPTVSITSTGDAGAVLPVFSLTGPTVRLEMRVHVEGVPGDVARVQWLVGAGLSSAGTSIPPVAGGDTGIGLVTAHVSCDEVRRGGYRYGLLVAVAHAGVRTSITSPLQGELAAVLARLLGRACPPAVTS